MKKRFTKRTKLIWSVVIGLVLIYLVMLIPPRAPAPLPAGEASPFVWNQDDYWTYLESRFLNARSLDSASLADSISIGLARADALLDSVGRIDADPSSPALSRIETIFFELCPLMAAQTDRLPELINLRNKLRMIVKDQSGHWDMSSPEARDRLYRLLFGTRMAVEEVIQQAPNAPSSALTMATDEPSATPAAEILGVTVHSGDILVSRGGAPTSALIARGNDYPGNFSHVALVHVDDVTGQVSIIEAHIEKGVAIASIDDYLRDTKLRILVLRLRADLPRLVADPMLPHKAATLALKRARREHIPYDFEMDFHDNTKLFCSEVASDPYRQLGIQLWMGMSHISSPGLRSWLAAFGVKHFETQEPSDLEYDPQLRVVAEWYDPDKLYKDRLDNAVIDVMLEGAETGRMLEYDWFRLPLARVAKAYSEVKNQWGVIGPVPEGMDAVAALKNVRFSADHAAIKKRLVSLADDFEKTKGYRPPYWQLVKLARQAESDYDSR